jgi:hypothetical protein
MHLKPNLVKELYSPHFRLYLRATDANLNDAYWINKPNALNLYFAFDYRPHNLIPTPAIILWIKIK